MDITLTAPLPYAILTPCFNEEQSIIPFLRKLENSLNKVPDSFLVVIVDDGSLDNSLLLLSEFKFSSSRLQLQVLKLKFNVGHQMAIYQGLLYLSTKELKNVIIMDSDGEDDPDAIPLVLQMEDYDIVEIKRGKRGENLTFRVAYIVYKLIFRFITGKSMDYGNYCMISRRIVDRISHSGFIHFPAYLLKQKDKRTHIVFNRGKRIHGKSKLGIKGLLIHAFKSFIEFGEDLLMLFLKSFVAICILLGVMFIDILYQKFIAKTAILGWFSTLAMEMLILAGMSLGFFVLGILLLNLIHHQNSRNQPIIYTLIAPFHDRIQLHEQDLRQKSN